MVRPSDHCFLYLLTSQKEKRQNTNGSHRSTQPIHLQTSLLGIISNHKFTLTLKFFTAILKLSRHLTVFLYHLLHTLDQLFKFSCSITKMFIVMLIKKNFFQTSICLKTCRLTITAISNHR